MSAAESGWWYARLYPGGLVHMDAAVDTLIPPLVTLAGNHGAERWFFIRYSDLAGPHLRFRLRGSPDLLDRAHREIPRLTSECDELARGKSPSVETIFPVSPQFFGGHQATANVAVYEPEDTKYGGSEGVILAEELFQASSTLALWANQFTKLPDRAALAVLLMRESLAAADSVSGAIVPSAGDFWHRHLDWWTRDAGSAAARLREDMRGQAQQDARRVAVRAEELLSDPAVAAWRLRWSAAMANYLRQASAAGLPRTLGHLMFHQIHMTLNRLGILPREEAVLGIIASACPWHAPQQGTPDRHIAAGQHIAAGRS